MNAGILKFPSVILFMLFAVFQANGQIKVSTYLDAGKINTYESAITSTALLADWQIGKVKFATGGQFELAGPSPNTFIGFYFQGGYGLAIKNFPFDIQGRFLLNPYSELIHEWNIGLLANVEKPHFTLKLGTGFRKYYITADAQAEYEIDDATSLYEKWNLLYEATWLLKPRANEWNVGASVTNLDYFLISQETNPMINIRGSWNISEPFTLYAEAWYKSAGTFNISANTFGYFFRTGLIWNVK